jgi:phospholipase C
MSIDPAPGTSFRDAEHVVILMQENRSFDHCFGALRGVRGFRDPRAHVQPNGNPVWFQTDGRGDTYAPFRLDIANSNATWIGGLPHTWPDQIDARAGGRYDQWLVAKPKRDLPFTLGHYTRADLPFYYALADAFTVCDQAFCSSLAGTTANRLFLWTGTLRNGAPDVARVMNADTYYDKEANWTTFPERLEAAGVSWRVYQNEISLESGLRGDAAQWLGSFTDNPLEWFTPYRVRFAASRRRYLATFIAEAPAQIAAREKQLADSALPTEQRAKLGRESATLKAELAAAEAERAVYTEAAWESVPPRTRSLHERAFATNAGDPQYRSLAELAYHDGAAERTTSVPAGDVLFQFRNDVESGSLPEVSWLIAPENFSDHPSAPWYGAWYVSEALDILTRNPEIWKKTVFILCYDENDGYFDHVPPFVAPHSERPATGKASAGLDTTVEWANVYDRDHAIGLGYRVPLVVASPWSRGGSVNSEVFDHTSVIRFLETWLGAKDHAVKETNISDWRRTICGDLTSVFQPYDGERLAWPPALDRDATVERINAARFRNPPRAGTPLTNAAIARADIGALQEAGTRPSCPLPYELVVNAVRRADGLAITLEARNRAFGTSSAGAPFNVYSYGSSFSSRAYAVSAGDAITDLIPVEASYRVRVDGPNGFMREFVHDAGAGDSNAGLSVAVDYDARTSKSGALSLSFVNHNTADEIVTVADESYGARARTIRVPPGQQTSISIPTASTQGWYDLSVRAAASTYRCAGRVETGKWSISDPAMAT